MNKKMLAALVIVVLAASASWILTFAPIKEELLSKRAALPGIIPIQEGSLRWREVDRDTLDSGLIVVEIADLVWSDRILTICLPDGEPIHAVVIKDIERW